MYQSTHGTHMQPQLTNRAAQETAVSRKPVPKMSSTEPLREANDLSDLTHPYKIKLSHKAGQTQNDQTPPLSSP